MHNGSSGINRCSRCQQSKRSSCSRFSSHNTVSGSRQPRRGFTILELLVTFGAISTLASLVLPAVGSAREASHQLQCKNQLRQIGLALHAYHNINRCLPPGWQWDVSGRSAYGWAVPLLPYLEQRAIYGQIDRNQVIGHPVNETARSTPIAAFLCPSDINEPMFTLFNEDEFTGTTAPLVDLPTASYIGVFGTIEPDDESPAPPGDGTFRESIPVRFADLRRGLSNTIIVGERMMAMVPSTWLGIDSRGEDAACRLVGVAITSPNCTLCDECEFSSRHPGGVNFLWADGHVRLLSETIGTNTYRQMARRTAEF